MPWMWESLIMAWERTDNRFCTFFFIYICTKHVLCEPCFDHIVGPIDSFSTITNKCWMIFWYNRPPNGGCVRIDSNLSTGLFKLLYDPCTGHSSVMGVGEFCYFRCVGDCGAAVFCGLFQFGQLDYYFCSKPSQIYNDWWTASYSGNIHSCCKTYTIERKGVHK